MSDSFIQVLDNSGTIKKIRSFQGAVGVNTVDAEATALVDSSGNVLVIAGDGSIDVNINQAATATLTNVSSSAANANLLASNAARKGMVVFNDGTTNLFIKFGTTASLTSFTYKVLAGGTFEMPVPIYTGNVDGIADSANGTWRVTELT